MVVNSSKFTKSRPAKFVVSAPPTHAPLRDAACTRWRPNRGALVAPFNLHPNHPPPVVRPRDVVHCTVHVKIRPQTP